MFQSKIFIGCVVVASLCIVLSGCPSERQLVDNTTAALDQEMSGYKRFVEVSQNEDESPAQQLQIWTKNLALLNSTLQSVIHKIRDDQQKRDAVAADLNLLKQRLDPIFDRHLNTTITVPSWWHEDSNKNIQAVYVQLQRLGSHYATLYMSNPNTPDIRIQVTINPKIFDTHEPCKDRVRLFSLGDSHSEYCMKAADQRCGHKLDMHCVEKVVLPHVGERLRGSMCVEITTNKITDPDGTKHEEEVITPKSWLSEISTCERTALILK